METIKQKVGRRFRELRKRAGFSSADSAAEAMEVSPTAVYELERGDNWISPEMLTLAANAFRASPEAFFGDGSPLAPTPQEALEVIARELEKRPTRDPMAERLAKLGPDARQAVEALMNGLEDSPPETHKGAPEKGK